MGLLAPGTGGRASPPDIMESLPQYRKGVPFLGQVQKPAGQVAERVHHSCQCEPLHLLKKEILSYPRTTCPHMSHCCRSIHSYVHLSPGLLPQPPYWPPHTHADIGWIQYWLSPPCSIGVGFSKIIYERLPRFRLNYPMISYYSIWFHLLKAAVKRLSSLIFLSAFILNKNSLSTKCALLMCHGACIIITQHWQNRHGQCYRLNCVFHSPYVGVLIPSTQNVRYIWSLKG